MQTFAVYVDNKPGVLNRVASLFRRRAFNIESLTVGHTETPGLSRMTIVVDTDERGARLVEANLYKLIPVRRVDNITRVPTIARDLAMIKVAATGDARTQVMQLVDVYRARIVDVSPESLVIETTGTEDKIDSLLEVLRPYGVIEMVRTGRVEMARGIMQPTPTGTQRSRALRARSRETPAADRCRSSRSARPVRRAFASPARAGKSDCGHVFRPDWRISNGEDVLRRGRGPQPDPGQESRGDRLRIAGARARAQPEGQRRQREGRACRPPAGRAPRRRPPASRSAMSPTSRSGPT